MSEKKSLADWELIERHYRAGIKTLRQIGEEYGVSHVAIQKRAKTYAWSRDLTEKIQQKAKELVTKREVTKLVTTEKLVTDAQTVQAYGAVLANEDLTQRQDLDAAAALTRSQMLELIALGNSEFSALLQWMAAEFDESGVDKNGRVIRDKANELYRYIIGMEGRIKMGRDLAAQHGIYIPLRRKVYGMDGDKNSNAAPFEEMLRSVGRLDL